MNPYTAFYRDCQKVDSIEAGRLNNFIFVNLKNKHQWLEIRKRASLKRLNKMTSDDWCENCLRNGDYTKIIGYREGDPIGEPIKTKIPKVGRCDLLVRLSEKWYQSSASDPKNHSSSPTAITEVGE